MLRAGVAAARGVANACGIAARSGRSGGGSTRRIPAFGGHRGSARSGGGTARCVPASRGRRGSARSGPGSAPLHRPRRPSRGSRDLTAGHLLTIRTTRELTTKTAKTGDAFSAILEEPIEVDGWVVAGPGARVDGRVVEADKGGRIKGKASLSIELTSLSIADGRKVEIVTSPVSNEAAANRKKDAAKVGVAAGAGAAVGAIAGGGSGAAIGALVGGGAGAAMRGEDAIIAAETVVSFELRSPVTIQEQKK